ncbi:G1 family glutamic endopeptidase [Stackebrandtia sp.]|jgi:hypothetical protein|uniref:G1 family glutamic endopeptidase n=1 Tax=Stackebrandtia sp. TaxID=2023065 RepID=UPI002D76A87D|nr:G1 family glutamic endopeptidase [Stackebrandtia sp.]
MYLSRIRRSAAVITAAAAILLAVGATPAQAATPAATSPHGHTAPLSPGHHSGRTTANTTSTNWFGYAASEGGYSSVESTWVEPAVDCSQGGHVVFWVGLDGWGSGTVEQTGSGADCDNGRASYYGWWETYPANAIQSYDDTVRAGDQFYAKVTFLGGNEYTLYLENRTEGWTRNQDVFGAQGASNASAEVVGETPSYSGGNASLPDFNSATFTDSNVDGSPIGNSRPDAIDLVRNGDLLASTGSLNGGGDAFAVTWQRNS